MTQIKVGLAHCPHPDGGGTVMTDSVTTNETCCWCGEKRERVVFAKYRTVEGHGSHFTEQYQVEEKDSWSDDCASRKLES